MGQDLWLRIGAVGALSVKNPAPSESDIRKHPSNLVAVGTFLSYEGCMMSGVPGYPTFLIPGSGIQTLVICASTYSTVQSNLDKWDKSVTKSSSHLQGFPT